MKSIKKFLFVVVALATALAFVSCSSDDDDDSPSTVAVYEHAVSGATTAVTFLSDGTWTCKVTSAGQSQEAMSGTYTGDPSKDGTIKIKITKNVAGEVDLPEDDVKIEGGKCTIGGLEYTRQ